MKDERIRLSYYFLFEEGIPLCPLNQHGPEKTNGPSYLTLRKREEKWTVVLTSYYSAHQHLGPEAKRPSARSARAGQLAATWAPPSIHSMRRRRQLYKYPAASPSRPSSLLLPVAVTRFVLAAFHLRATPRHGFLPRRIRPLLRHPRQGQIPPPATLFCRTSIHRFIDPCA